MNKENPLVSVIVTTYNRKELLTETLDSIINQTFTDFELIIIDNYSNYEFISYVNSFSDNRIRAFQNQNNGIIAVNRNFGIKKAKGKYIAFCDDDDLWLPQKIEEQLKHFDNDIIGLGTSSILFGDLSFYRQKTIRNNILLKFDDILRDGGVPLSSLMIKNLGFLFDERESFIAVEDLDLQLTLTLKTGKGIKLLSTPLIRYRVQSPNDNTFIEKSKNQMNIIKKYEKFLSKNQLDKLFSGYYNYLGLKCLKSKKSGASYHFKKAIKYGSLKGKLLGICGMIISFFPPFLITLLLKKYYIVRQASK